jgi:hypothetical protein
METGTLSPPAAKRALMVYFGKSLDLAQDRTMAGLSWAFAAAIVGMRPGPWATTAAKVSRLLPRLDAVAVGDVQDKFFNDATATEPLSGLNEV